MAKRYRRAIGTTSRCEIASESLEQVARRLGTREERFHAACRCGLEATLQGKPLLQFAEKMTQIGLDGLSRYQPHNVDLLRPLIQQLQTGQSPAVALLDIWKKDPKPETVIEAVRY